MASSVRARLGYPARVSHAGTLLAESTAAVRVDIPDAAPTLWFPTAGIDAGALERLATDLWRRGTGDLVDHVAFDHDRCEVLVIDGRDGDDARDVTTKRWPTWGDAADLIDVLDVSAAGSGRFVSEPRSDWRRPVVEGSQLLGQAIVAAGRLAPGRRVVSASVVLVRAADAGEPYVLELGQISSGRTFTSFDVRVTQHERTCAAGTLLLDVTAADVIRHHDPAPPVVGPYEAVPYDMSVTGRDLRIVDDAYTGDPHAPVGPPELDAWVRFRDVPDDQPIHAGLLAQFTGHLSIAAALRPHAGIGQDQAHHTLSTAINAISLSIHAPVRADGWLLYHHRSSFAGDGMTHAACRVHDEHGGLVASFGVDAMVRAFDDPARGADVRTAL